MALLFCRNGLVVEVEVAEVVVVEDKSHLINPTEASWINAADPLGLRRWKVVLPAYKVCPP